MDGQESDSMKGFANRPRWTKYIVQKEKMIIHLFHGNPKIKSPASTANDIKGIRFTSPEFGEVEQISLWDFPGMFDLHSLIPTTDIGC